MPEEGVDLSPSSELLTTEEILRLVRTFCLLVLSHSAITCTCKQWRLHCVSSSVAQAPTP